MRSEHDTHIDTDTGTRFDTDPDPDARGDTGTTRTIPAPSRRRVLEYSATATVAGVIGTGTAALATDGTETAATDETAGSEATIEGAMYAYQYTPNSRIRIRERGLTWRPEDLPTYGTYVVSYERAPSLRAFLFAETSLPDSDEPLDLQRTSSSEYHHIRGPFTGVELTLEE
ncbi:hypothetical protein [Halobiforma nitratireducens]|uniref:Uncharacterized protein n=1 Tax=Halobiforma nitratireducens JCM 10879 TaxID=1227454 RepID=M0LU25_9EURY|nr:hypothetical protein [Halobiforma nitratireducens]EMA36663.1 hypothetical protein C446_11492 [Halobiforma nitratireducens JCM 10879]